MLTDIITLEIISPEKSLLKAQVSRVELPGAAGRFVVLKNHAPLISSLCEGEIVYMSRNETGKLAVSSGFVKVEDNHVMACVEL